MDTSQRTTCALCGALKKRGEVTKRADGSHVCTETALCGAPAPHANVHSLLAHREGVVDINRRRGRHKSRLHRPADGGKDE